MKRRSLIAGLAALSGTAASPAAWADFGPVAYLAAGRLATGQHILGGLTADGHLLLQRPLPARGHAAAIHPTKALIAVFARRPGRFLMLVDARSGAVQHVQSAPAGRHFYGHGMFSDDGRRLYTTENAYATGEGRIGIWECGDGLRRIAEIASGGIGPHDIKPGPDGTRMIVANGGIRTHPDTGRDKLNLDTMRPNIAILRAETGNIEQIIEPETALRLNSTRHLAVNDRGDIAVACQWQGDPFDGVPLLAIIAPGADTLVFAPADPATLISVQGYAGSVAFSGDARHVAITCPRGGEILIFDAASGEMSARWQRRDVCGLAEAPSGLVATDGNGGYTTLKLGADRAAVTGQHRNAVAWDNHLIAVHSA